MILFLLAHGKGLRQWLTLLSLTMLLMTTLLVVFLNQQAPTLAIANPYQVTYRVTDQWNTGYNIEVKITNTGANSVKNWTISWQLSQGERRIDDTWDANCSLANNRISCSNLGWNATIGVNKSVKFGLDLYGNGKVTQPASFIVNGVTVLAQGNNNPTATATATKAPVTVTPTKIPATTTPTPTNVPTTVTPTNVPTTATPTNVPATVTPTNVPATATPTKTATTGPQPTNTPPPPTATPTPPPPGGGNWWKPTPAKPIAWHWQLSQEFVFPRDVIAGVTVYDLDGELTSADTVAKLHALGPDIKVICYIDAGVYETYRSDASRFPQSVIGNADEGWDGSFWLDIRQTDIILPLMRDRMQHWCKDKGFDAVEPDETEVWSNNPGFPITKDQNNFYNRKIAELAHSLGLSVGLKGNTTEAPELWPYFDWTLNEQCWQYKECDLLKSSFIDHGKAVFNIEYNTNPDCATSNRWQMNSARRDLNLMGPTHSKYSFAPCVPYSKITW